MPLSVILLSAALTLSGCAWVNGGRAVAADSKPGQQVGLPDGRKINLRCRGSGRPTVLLESGFGAASGAWYKVQPELARTTRVCAYDRAGYGFSDPGPLPRDGAAIARDLAQALAAARIKGPFIVVGHSAGGLYGRLFAARDIGAVEGLVLLDPTFERRAAAPSGDGLDGIRRRLQRCLAAAEAQPQPPARDPQWNGCVSSTADAHPLEVAHRPDTWRDQLSELDNIFGRTSEQVFRTRGLLKSIPTYVITASETAAAAPAYGFNPPRSVWELQHEMIAAGSLEGSQQTVLSSHMVMLDRPDVVIAVVREMIAAARGDRPPAQLPPSETTAPIYPEIFTLPGNDPLKAPDPPLPSMSAPDAEPSDFETLR